MRIKIKLISNMYPSKRDKLFGIFVKETQNNLEAFGAIFNNLVIIRGKRKNIFSKIFTYLFFYIKSILGIFDKKQDIIYFHFLTHNIPIIWFYTYFQNKPVVINLHGSDIHKLTAGSFIDKVQAYILTKVDQVIVPSVYFKNVVEDRYKHLRRNMYIYPSGGIDTKLFSSDVKEETASLTISFVSRIDKGKGWDKFIDIVEGLSNNGISCKAIIAGDGYERGKMINRLEKNKYKDTFEYVGFQNKQNLVEIYKKSSIFIFPTELPESLGLVGLEAMACNNIVFARNIGGATGYIVPNENGFLFNTTQEVIKMIIEYLSYPIDKKIEIQKNARKTALKYDSDYVAKQLYNNFKSYVV